jgi:hypothetical protein
MNEFDSTSVIDQLQHVEKIYSHHNQLDYETSGMAAKRNVGMALILMNVPDTSTCRKRECKPNRIFQTVSHLVDESYKLRCVLAAPAASNSKSFESMNMNRGRCVEVQKF